MLRRVPRIHSYLNKNSLFTNRNFTLSAQNNGTKVGVFKTQNFNHVYRTFCSEQKPQDQESTPPVNSIHKVVPSKFDSIITDEHTKQILKEEKTILEALVKFVSKSSYNTEEDIDLLQSAIRKLEELFLLVVVGEFNSGKSSFLNALLGEKYLTEGITPTTQKIGVIKFGDRKRVQSDTTNLENIHLPIPWLQEINVVDTPGTNAIIRGHELITEHFIPQADLVLFITSIERPLTESERLFLEKIRKWNKKIIMIVTKVDHVDKQEDLDQAIDYVTSNFEKTTGTAPILFPISSKLALKEKLAENVPEHLLAARKWNQFNKLEDFIHKQLDVNQRISLKLSTPLGISSRLVSKYQDILTKRQVILKTDQDTLVSIEQLIDFYTEEMKRGILLTSFPLLPFFIFFLSSTFLAPFSSFYLE